MKKIFLLFTLLFMFQQIIYSQKKGKEFRDSLLSVLKTQKGNIAEVNTLIALSFQFRNSDPDTSLYFADKALNLATKLDYKTGIAYAYHRIGLGYEALQQFEEALENVQSALAIYDQSIASEKGEERDKVMDQKGNAYTSLGNIYYSLGNFAEAMKGFSASLKINEEMGDKPGIAADYNNIGVIYAEQGNYPESLKAQLAGLKTREIMHDSAGMAASYCNIGNVYDGMSNYPEALKNHLASLKIWEETGDIGGVADAYNNIGSVYDGMKNFPEALKNHFTSLKIKKELGDQMGIATSYFSIGFVYQEQGNYHEALKNNFAALKISEEVGDTENIANIYTELGNIYTKQRRYNDARDYLEKGLSLSKKIGSLEHVYDTYSVFTKLDSAMGNYKDAFEHHKLYNAYRDSLFNEENTKKLVQAQMQYDFDKKESAAKAEQDKKDALTKAEITRQKIVRNFSLAGAFGILSLSGYVIYNFRKRKKLESMQELANERLRISRELHDDIGSTLGSIAVYSDVAKNRSLKNDNPLEILSKIGTASRELIEKMSDIVWSLNPENETFEQMQSRMQAFAAMILTGRNISFEFKNDEQLNALVLKSEQRKNIFLIYKEAIHNIVKYADCKNVFIAISKSNNQLFLTIRDDGKGFETSPLPPLKEESSLGGNGLKNMKARAMEMNAFFNITSLKNEGTTIELKINI